jgi:agmatinase
LNPLAIKTGAAFFALYIAFALLPHQSAYGQWRIPDEFQSQAAVLTDQQLEFITSGAVLEFMPERQLEHELATRDADSLQSMVDDIMALARQMGYDPERDMGAAPLNLTSDNFNRRTLPTPEPLRELDREPGPFSVHRYLFPKSGVPTFGGASVAIWPEDLVAGKVDVAIIGVPSNMSSGRRDAGWAPDEMRALNTLATPDVQSLLRPFEVLSIVDYGNFLIDNMNIERSVEHVIARVAETYQAGAVPMLVGGDTSVLYPGVKGVAKARGAGSFGLLHFSAHPDVDRSGDHTISDTQAMFRLLDEGVVKGSETVQVGLRGPAVDLETLRWLRSKNVRYHTMAEIERRGFDKVVKRILREVDQGPGAFFVSIDVSVIDPSEMVGAGRIEPRGLRLADVARAIRHVCASKDVVGFEITDLAPMLDISRLSIANANALLNACLAGMAVRKAGLEPDFVHPVALDHGQ